MRRHLTVGQRAMLAERLANLSVGRPNGNSRESVNYSRTKAANVAGTHPEAISQIRVIREFAPAEAHRVETGQNSLEATYKVAAKNKKDTFAKETPEKAATPRRAMWPKSWRFCPHIVRTHARFLYAGMSKNNVALPGEGSSF
jgi:hypothetical protein